MNSFWNETGLVQVIWNGQSGFYKIDICNIKTHKGQALTLRLHHSASVNIFGIEIFKTKKKINQGTSNIHRTKP